MYFSLVDLLRFFAALSVMCFHYFAGNTQTLKEPLNTFINFGYLGVPLFFSISGFVIYFSLKKSLKEYSLGRFLRLYPLFWFICTLTYVLTLIFPNSNPVSFSVFLQNLLIVNNGDVSKMVDGSYWTLTLEILFYLYIGLFVYFFSLKKVEWFYIFWLFITIVAFSSGLYNNFIFKLLLVRFSPYFIFGGMLGLIFEHWHESKNLARTRFVVWLLLASILPIYISHILNNSTLAVTNSFGIYNRDSLIRVELIFLILPIAVYSSTLISSRIFLKLCKIAGGVTYPLYLLHEKIGKMMVAYFNFPIKIIGRYVIIVVFMLFTSYAISYFELKYRKKLYILLMDKLVKVYD